MRKLIYLVVVLLGTGTSGLSYTQSDSVVQIREGRDFYPLNRSSFLLRDTTGRLTLDSVIRPGTHFLPITQEIYNFNQDKGVGVYWFRCTLQNLTPVALRELFCLHPGLDTLEAFVFNPDGTTHHSLSRAGEPTQSKALFISQQIVIPLELQPGITRIYLRIVNHSIRSREVSSIIASLADERGFVNYFLEYRLYHGVAIGMLLLILVLHIFIYLYIRDATYLVFLVNVFFTLIYVILRKNYHFEFDFLAPFYGFLTRAHDTVGVLLSITAIWFAQAFLNTRREDVVMHRTMNGLMIILGVLAVGQISLQWIQLMNTLTIYLGFISAILVILSSVRSYLRGNKLALYVFFGFILLAFVPLIYVMPMPNYLHYRNDESDLQYIGEAVRSVIFAVGIANRFYLLKKQVAYHEIEKKELALANEQQLRGEKERISRDLHDNIGSELAILSMELWQLSKKYPTDASIAAALVTKGSIYDQLRDTIWAIEKNHVKMEDLESRINTMVCKHATSNPGIKFDLETSTSDIPFSLSPAQSINLYRILQEAVQNGVIHSACRMIKVDIRADAAKGQLYAEVSDDGNGFDYNQSKLDAENHYGLRNMKRRAVEVHGQLEIVSKLSAGTRIMLRFPVRVSENGQ